jgi:signal transduction histidine kinase
MKRILTIVLCLFCLIPKAQKQGQALIDSLVFILPHQQDDTNKIKLLVAISKSYVTVSPKDGYPYANSGMGLAEKLQWKRGIADLNNNLGLLTCDTGNTAGSRNYFEKSLAINKEMNAKSFMIANINNIGRSYEREADYIKASFYYFKALALAEETGNDEQAALVGTNITALYLLQKDFQKATEYADLTIKKGEAANALNHVAKAYELLGVLYLETNDTPSSVKNFNEALALDVKLGNNIAAVGVLSNLGTLEADMQKGIDIFLRAQTILDSVSPSSLNSIMNLTNLGLSYTSLAKSKTGEQRKNDSKKAQAYFERAESLSEATHNAEFKADIKLGMADLEEENGKYKEALHNYREYTAINDSVYSQENKNKIAALESQRAIDRKDQEIENKRLQISNQRKSLWLLLGGLIFLIVAGTLLYRQTIIRKKTNQTLLKLNAELNEANRVKSKFFGIISHDLRSPVANLINFLDLQKRKPGSMTPEQVEARELKISQSARTLLETMEAMLLWSKGQMEHFAPALQDIRINNLFGFLKQFFSATGTVSLTFSGAADLAVQSDENYLKSIMQNLTANAIKALGHTSDARIDWKARQEGANIFLSITDNGPGVNNEQLKALYDDTASSGARQGLGLHIIRDLAKAINCTITLTANKQSGTEFILCLPDAHS